ncbi:fungal-specific transcription factor domain-domain-containing protein, partial [Clohesyomyces aquaticus]
LPSAEEIIEACRVFTTSYFQLGFIPKTSFFERIQRDEVSDFLLLSILCLSARFTPCLIQRYGSTTKATERFMTAALERVPHELYNTNLENIQALFLLSIAEWGNGDRDRSSIHMGVAVRMAAMMKLHREETYELPPDATNDQIIFAETARRTFWMIQSQDNLHSGYSSPLPFSCEDITALLPCGESNFLFGIRPAERAALPSTPPALANPSLVDSPRRPLFATLIQSHSLWGQVARRACRPGSATLGPTSEYMSMAATLRRFEESLPTQHRWSIWSVKVWKDLGFELAYLSVVMVIRLSNILLRRMYLENIKASISTAKDNGGPSGFWKPVSDELFRDVVELYQQIEVSFTMREQTEGYPAILVFPIYVCGSLALNLWQCPKLCPRLADKASAMLLRCLKVITDLQHAWPMARKWQEGLQQAA